METATSATYNIDLSPDLSSWSLSPWSPQIIPNNCLPLVIQIRTPQLCSCRDPQQECQWRCIISTGWNWRNFVGIAREFATLFESSYASSITSRKSKKKQGSWFQDQKAGAKSLWIRPEAVPQGHLSLHRTCGKYQLLFISRNIACPIFSPTFKFWY